MKPMLTLLAALVIATSAFAHGPNRGPNGGPQADAGDYHVEMIAKDTALTLYLRDEDDKPVRAEGHKATAILVVDGKPQRVELAPDGPNRLTGKAAVALPVKLKGAVQITLPTGKTVQAKFE